MEPDITMPDELSAEGTLNIELELEQFRLKWRNEIHQQQAQQLFPDNNPVPGSAMSQRRDVSQVGRSSPSSDQPSREDQARYLFTQGVSAEQNGRLYDAIQYYRRAVQLVPDIDMRVEDVNKPSRRERVREESECSAGGASDAGGDGDDLTDLTEHIMRAKISDDDQFVCQPDLEQQATHLSSLPVEVLTYIFKWVVSSDHDVHSLEQLSRVCRGFFLCARDEELWRLICCRTWEKNCGRPASFGSYRNMYIERPHVRFNGCYMSKSTYYRQGEKSLDNCYRPFHIVEYYRYIRFFPDGQVLMLTSPDDPYIVLPNLRTRSNSSNIQGLLVGFYKLVGDRVTLVLKRKPVKSDYQPWVNRYGRQKMAAQNNNNEPEQSFEAEFMLKNVGARRHWQLTWLHYSLHTVYRLTREETLVDFELTSNSYSPLLFSRVRSFTAFADKPLN